MIPKDFGVLSPREAVERITHGLDESVYIPVTELPKTTGLTPGELMDELKAGHLVARGFETKDGFESVCVRFDELILWLTSDTPLAKRAVAYMEKEQPRVAYATAKKPYILRASDSSESERRRLLDSIALPAIFRRGSRPR